jgi:sortase A
LSIGDNISYTTVYGTRKYSVSYVGTISNTDWTYLQGTSDNRITLTTCLADHPESRVVVQAVEVLKK